QNDIYRAGGDAAFGTILEITFMFLMVVPCVYLTGIRWHLSYFIVFACCYADEIIRFVLMQLHMKSGRWVKPVTEQGRAALEEFRSVRGGKAA
ncbi:MAG: MATE family efflux transporter, partial [Clostridia bacterium]|nr:MATE family efflux transporter [Clostridia bacterium]